MSEPERTRPETTPDGGPAAGLTVARSAEDQAAWHRAGVIRLLLATLFARPSNLMILDEPTNHLDLPAIEQLEQALAGYRGTLLLVTHDRRMLAAVEAARAMRDAGAGSIGVVEGGRLVGIATRDLGVRQVRFTGGEPLLRRDLAFPAFSRSSWDGNPGNGGNGRQPWRNDSGYAGDPKVAGDTGWDGDVAGMLNRSLRWDTRQLVDTHGRFALPLRAVVGPGVTDSPVVDVTPRRVQRFRCLPGERIRWTFGKASGTVTAAADGTVTVPRLRLGADWTQLVLERG